MRDQNDEPISDELSDAIALLREKPVVRPEWRNELLRRADAAVSTDVQPVARTSRVSLSVP